MIKLGKLKMKPGGRKQKKDCLNDNILTVEGTPEQSQAEATATNLKPKISLKKFRTNRIRKFRFLRKKEDSVSFSTGENSLVLPTSPNSDEALADSNRDGICGGICGMAAAENLTPRPKTPQDDVDHVTSLHELQSQVLSLNDELDHVYMERRDALNALGKLIDVSNSAAMDHTELEEIRMMLTAECPESTFTSSTMRPFYSRMCYGCGE